MKAIILAAGLGTRLLPHTLAIPKPLFTVGDVPVLHITLKKLDAAGFTGVIINLHHLAENIRDFLKSRKYSMEVRTIHEPEILGTGGAVKNAEHFLCGDCEPFLVVNSDILTDIAPDDACRRHLSHDSPITMMVHDHPRFNSVYTDEDGFVTGFARIGDSGAGCCAFTGMSVMNPEVTDLIPKNKFIDLVTIFKGLIESGGTVRAEFASGHYWRDIGTPESYKRAVFEALAPDAFAEAFQTPPPGYGEISRETLEGDGSDRKWTRLGFGGKTMIMVEHGIDASPDTSEAEAFIKIGRHLHKKGICVPEQYARDTLAGCVFMEDLGDVRLHDLTEARGLRPGLMDLYKKVVWQLIKLSIRGREGFDTAWTWQTPFYDRELILEKECGYFADSFLRGYAGMNIATGDFADEFQLIAENAADSACTGFMHRDMQSRNIMIKNGDPGFIDFQGGRIGPLEYDLASLLHDPYANLSKEVKKELFHHAVAVLADDLEGDAVLDTEKFAKCFTWCGVARLLQALGAFSFLSRVKKKKRFARYIPAALKTLHENLQAAGDERLDGLGGVVRGVLRDRSFL